MYVTLNLHGLDLPTLSTLPCRSRAELCEMSESVNNKQSHQTERGGFQNITDKAGTNADSNTASFWKSLFKSP